MNVVSLLDRRKLNHSQKETAAMPTEQEWLARKSQMEIDALNLDQEAKRTLKEEINKIENALDALITVMLGMKTGRSKLEREAATAALAKHRLAVNALGVLLHEISGGSLNTMRLVCSRVCGLHDVGSSTDNSIRAVRRRASDKRAAYTRLSFIDHAWNEIGHWRA